MRRGWSQDADAFFAATAGRANDDGSIRDVWAATPAERVVMARPGRKRCTARSRRPSFDRGAGFVMRARAQGCASRWQRPRRRRIWRIAFARFPTATGSRRCQPGRRLRQAAPDIFLEAARRIGVAPAQCHRVRDAPLGIGPRRRRHGRGGAHHHLARQRLGRPQRAWRARWISEPNALSDPSCLTKEDHHVEGIAQASTRADYAGARLLDPQRRLTFDLDPLRTIVASRMAVQRNAAAGSRAWTARTSTLRVLANGRHLVPRGRQRARHRQPARGRRFEARDLQHLRAREETQLSGPVRRAAASSRSARPRASAASPTSWTGRT